MKAFRQYNPKPARLTLGEYESWDDVPGYTKLHQANVEFEENRKLREDTKYLAEVLLTRQIKIVNRAPWWKFWARDYHIEVEE